MTASLSHRIYSYCNAVLLATLLLVSGPLRAAPVNGQNANDLLCEFSTPTTDTTPVYTQSTAQNGQAGPNAIGCGAPANIALDAAHHYLYVGEGNCRVMVYALQTDNSLSTASGGHTASYAIGEPNLTTANCVTSQAGIQYPTGVAIDTADQLLFVADGDSNRVVAYSTSSLASGKNASYVLGQTSFTGGGGSATQSTMSFPADVAYDAVNNRLFVADFNNNRVLVFNTNVTNGLVGWWRFDEGSGTSAADFSGNGNTGTLKNSPSWVAGQIGDAVSLNGTNQYVDIANPSNFNFEYNQPFTLMAWVNRNSSSDSDDEMIDKVNQGSANGFTDWMTNNGNTDIFSNGPPNNITCTSNCIVIGLKDSDNDGIGVAATNTPAAPGAWHHIAITYDGSSNSSGVKIYVDGANQTLTFEGGGCTNCFSGTMKNTNDLWLGIDYTSDSSDYFHGKMDDVRVYNRALSASEIPTIYMTGQNAAYVLGQSSFTGSGHGHTQSTMYGPDGLAFDPVNERLFVSEQLNHRVTVWNVAPASIANGENASSVLGQSSFTVNSINQGGGAGAPTQSSMYRPAALGFDYYNQRLFVADADNNRVLVFNVRPGTISNGENAVAVLGQSSFTGSGANTTQAGLNLPGAAFYDAGSGRVFVGDGSNNRVIIFNGSYSGGSPSDWTPGYD